MDPTLTLRPSTAADREFLFQVYAGTRLEEMARVDWDAAQIERFLRMQFEAQDSYYRENYPGCEFLVIEAGGAPGGRLYLHRRPDEIRIMDIALLTEHRGRGAGTALLRQILSEGRRKNLPVTIHVERFNPALRLYTRLGFRPAEDKGVYLFLKWTPAPSEGENGTHHPS